MYLPVGGVDSICLVRMASVLVVLTRHRASPQGTLPRWLHTETMPFHRASFPGGSTDEALCYNLPVTTPKAYQQPNTREPPPFNFFPTSLGPEAVNDTGRAGLSARLGDNSYQAGSALRVWNPQRTSYVAAFLPRCLAGTRTISLIQSGPNFVAKNSYGPGIISTC